MVAINNKQINKKLAGFSLPEIIVVMACLTIIASLGFGDILRLFTKQMVEQEKNDLVEIHKAIEAYAKNERVLPLDTNLCEEAPDGATPENNTMWSVQLSKYSNMTPDQICFDRWGRVRHYLAKSYEQDYRGGEYKYNVYFASVLSEGPNAAKDTADWTTLTGFTTYNLVSDDLMIKYNDNDYKVGLYEETLNRIETLEQYLERYANAKLYAALSAGVTDYAKYIMFPKDGNSSDPGKYFHHSDISGLDSNLSVETISEPFSATALTKVLGLPEYVGQNAISGKTMWYVSNPGKNRARPCDSAKNAAPYYPPAIIIKTNDAALDGC